MPQIIGKILDSAGLPISCKLAVQLDDPLIFSASMADEVRTTAEAVFDVPGGNISVSLLESATQRTTYDFHLYVPLESALFYELDGEPYTGLTHTDEGLSITYTGPAPSAGRRELFKEVLEGRQTVSRFKAIVPIGTTVQFATLFGQRITAARFVDRSYYQEILASLPGASSAINNNSYLTRAEFSSVQSAIAALEIEIAQVAALAGLENTVSPGMFALASDLLQAQQSLTTLQSQVTQIQNGANSSNLETRVAALEAGGSSGGGGGGAGTAFLPFSTTISLSSTATGYAEKLVTGALVFTPNTVGPVIGSMAFLTLVADGVNTPDFSAFKLWSGTGQYNNTAGIKNRIIFRYDGLSYWYVIGQEIGTSTTPAADTTAPVLQTIALDNSTFDKVVLTYNEALAGTSIPTASYSATGRSITSAVVSGITVTVSFSAAVTAGGTITFAYSGNQVKDAAGNASATFSQSVTRPSSDTIAPVLQTAVLNQTTFDRVLLTYSEALAGTTIPTVSYSITGRTITSATVSGSTITVIFSSAVAGGQTVTLGYTGTQVQDAAGNSAAPFSQNFTRVATDTTGPVLQTAVLNQTTFDRVLLTFDEPLTSVALSSANFSATGLTVASASASGSTATVIFSSALGDGLSTTLSGITGAVTDVVGNPSSPFSQSLTRPSTYGLITFRNLLKVTQPSAGTILESTPSGASTLPKGATAVPTFKQGDYIQFTANDIPNNTSFLVFFSAVDNQDYANTATQNSLAAVSIRGGQTYLSTFPPFDGSGGVALTSSILSTGALVRMAWVGTDCIISYSNNGGTSFTTATTYAGIMPSSGTVFAKVGIGFSSGTKTLIGLTKGVV